MPLLAAGRPRTYQASKCGRWLPQNTEPEDSRDNEGLGDLIALIKTCPFICRGKGSFGSPGKLMLEPMVVRQLLTGLKSG